MTISISRSLYCQMISSLRTQGGNQNQSREESLLGTSFNTLGIVSSLGNFNSHPRKHRDPIKHQREKHNPALWDIYFYSANLSSKTSRLQAPSIPGISSPAIQQQEAV